MATTERSTTSTSEPEAETTTGQGALAAARDGADALAGTARDVAGEIATRLPEAAASTRGAVEEASRRIEASSTGTLTIGTSLWLGIAIGLLVGGANRILVALALIPAAAMGATLLDRSGGPTGSSARNAR
jgi:hypothetical protein